jgi:hypothetical protein
MTLKNIFLFLLFISAARYADAQAGAGQANEKGFVYHNYEVTFYNLKFHTTYKEDTSKVKKAGNSPDDYFNSFMNITDYDYNKYKLNYPLAKSFDSAAFVVKDKNGRKLKVGTIEVIVISKAQGMKPLTCEGPVLSKEAADAMNNTAPGDQIIFRTVEVFDSTLNKKLIIPNFLIVYN